MKFYFWNEHPYVNIPWAIIGNLNITLDLNEIPSFNQDSSSLSSSIK